MSPIWGQHAEDLNLSLPGIVCVGCDLTFLEDASPRFDDSYPALVVNSGTAHTPIIWMRERTKEEGKDRLHEYLFRQSRPRRRGAERGGSLCRDLHILLASAAA